MIAVVTGGAGFIGGHLVDALVARGDEVRVLDDLSAGRREDVHTDALLFVGDVADEAFVNRVLEGAEVVFHQAAHRSVFRSVEHPLESDLANTHGTLTVLESARKLGVGRVVCASSSSVYGGADQLPTPESAPTLPRSPYAVSKLAGEHYCRVYAELHGLETVALRYFNVYGPRQRPDSAYAAVIPLFIEALRRDGAPLVHGDGHQSRDFTFIADVVRANLAAAAAPAEAAMGRAFNVAGGHAYSLLELLERLGSILGISPRPAFGDARPGDVRHSLAAIDAARDALGWAPQIGFGEGLKATVAWFT